MSLGGEMLTVGITDGLVWLLLLPSEAGVKSPKKTWCWCWCWCCWCGCLLLLVLVLVLVLLLLLLVVVSSLPSTHEMEMAGMGTEDELICAGCIIVVVVQVIGGESGVKRFVKSPLVKWFDIVA